jgi:DNA-binding NarL/FixJ family response regulator
MLVEDNDLMREAFRRILQAAPEFELVAEAEETDGAVAAAEESRPDLVLMDLRIPGAGGIEATRRIKRRHPNIRVAAWTAYSDPDFLRGMFDAGASGYLVKGTTGDAFLSSLRRLAAGDEVITPSDLGGGH